LSWWFQFTLPPHLDERRRVGGSCFDAGVLTLYPPGNRSCYIYAMKKILAAVLLLMVFASPMIASAQVHHHHRHHHHHHHA
jgi:hypothetical protein